MITLSELEDLIDWPTVLAAPRYAGGHEEVMRSIFRDARVLAWWTSGDYQGEIAVAHQLADGRVTVMTDYYGSCSGCDAWEGSSEEDARKMVLDLVRSARVFGDAGEAAEWCGDIDPKENPQQFPFREAAGLVAGLRLSRWRTPTVVSLAEAIRADRAFDRLPILADALEDAGCDDAALLAACRPGGKNRTTEDLVRDLASP